VSDATRLSLKLFVRFISQLLYKLSLEGFALNNAVWALYEVTKKMFLLNMNIMLFLKNENPARSVRQD